jgi:hypothetical protein
MFIFHTLFQLYHCKFPIHYLKDIYDTGFSNTKVDLQCTPMYNFCEPEERGQWCDIFVALVEYLRSGESQVQWLSKSHPKNLIHKVLPPGKCELMLGSGKAACHGGFGGCGFGGCESVSGDWDWAVVDGGAEGGIGASSIAE